MPRVYLKTKSARGKVYDCRACGEPITEGQQFYQWSRRFGRSGMTYFKHAACGRPRPTELSSRKTAALEEAVNDASPTIDQWAPAMPEDVADEGAHDTSDLKEALEAIADTAEEIGQEYQDGFDNMPEGLNQGDTAMAMEDVAQRLDEWVSELRDWEPDEEMPEYPERDQYVAGDEGDQLWRDDCEAAFDQWVENTRTAASDAIQDWPEYEG